MLDAEERIFARKKAKGWGTEIVGESAGQRVSRLPEKLRNAGLFVSEAARFVHHIHDKQERNGMETEQKEIGERLEAATTLLERTLNWLEERQGALTGEVERISATVEQSRREAELGEKLAAAEREDVYKRQRGHRVMLTWEAAEKALPSLLGMAVDYRPGWDGHDARRKIGLLTEVDLIGQRLVVRGYLYACLLYTSRCV